MQNILNSEYLYTRVRLQGRTYEDIQRERDEILNTSVEDIKFYASMIKLGMNQNYCCVVGNGGKIKENKNMFDKIRMFL